MDIAIIQKGVLMVIFIIVAVMLILWFSAGYIVFSIAIKSKSNKSIVFGEHKELAKIEREYNWISNVTERTVLSADDLSLHCYEYINNDNGNFCILIHGYGGQASNMVDQMDHFIDLGYNVVAVDLRGHGKSEGKYYGLGYLDKDDIAIWIKEIKENYHCYNIVIYGISMGGATAIMTGGLGIENVSAIISDSAPSDFASMFSRILKYKVGTFFGWFIIKSLVLFVKCFAGYSLRDASSINSMPLITVPVLLIHGSKDGFVPPVMMEMLYNCCTSKKTKLTVDEADHTQSSRTDPIKYWDTIKRFLYDVCEKR